MYAPTWTPFFGVHGIGTTNAYIIFYRYTALEGNQFYMQRNGLLHANLDEKRYSFGKHEGTEL